MVTAREAEGAEQGHGPMLIMPFLLAPGHHEEEEVAIELDVFPSLGVLVEVFERLLELAVVLLACRSELDGEGMCAGSSENVQDNLQLGPGKGPFGSWMDVEDDLRPKAGGVACDSSPTPTDSTDGGNEGRVRVDEVDGGACLEEYFT